MEEIRKLLHKLQFDYYEHGSRMDTIVPDSDIKNILELIEQKIKEAKIIKANDYLIELSNEQYEVVTEDELNKIYDSADEFDGFTGIRVVGKIKTLGEK